MQRSELAHNLFRYALGNKHKDVEIWDNIVEKTEKRLARWKAQYFSLGARRVLINSFLDSLTNLCYVLFPLAYQGGKTTGQVERFSLA